MNDFMHQRGTLFYIIKLYLLPVATYYSFARVRYFYYNAKGPYVFTPRVLNY